MIKIKRIKVNEIKPYWRNPRINRDAIDIVKKSIEKYGYNQPIVIDRNNVIVVGHTRYYAIKELGFDEIDVYETDLDEKKCQEYRIVDNKTNEYSFWDYEKLEAELRTLDLNDLKDFFKNDEEFLSKIGNINIDIKDDKNFDLGDIEKKIENKKRLVEVICNHCGKSFLVDLDELQGKYERKLLNID